MDKLLASANSKLRGVAGQSKRKIMVGQGNVISSMGVNKVTVPPDNPYGGKKKHK